MVSRRMYITLYFPPALKQYVMFILGCIRSSNPEFDYDQPELEEEV